MCLIQDSDLRKMILCAGLQSSGSTLISWCFLQRIDLDGILDLETDRLRPLPDINAPGAWVKMTICCFRWGEVAEYFRWFGLDPKPLLIVRDVRDVYASLCTKPYGKNGVTAEDPPLRIRLLRFLNDWRFFRQNDLPVVRYEDLISDPEETLKEACNLLSLDWDRNMIEWKKPPDKIADITCGSPTFHNTRDKTGVIETIKKLPVNGHRSIPKNEIEWIEKVFEEFNIYEGYPVHRNDFKILDNFSIPDIRQTRRIELEQSKRDKFKLANDIDRIRRHPVIGPVMKLWTYVNPSLSSIGAVGHEDCDPQ